MILGGSKFESEMQVRPDDLDMNRHVHHSRHFDYTMIDLQTGRAEKIPDSIVCKYSI